jgi:hypothetical protein
MDVTESYMQVRIRTTLGETERKVHTPLEYVKVAGRPAQLPPNSPHWWDRNLGFWDNYFLWPERVPGSLLRAWRMWRIEENGSATAMTEPQANKNAAIHVGNAARERDRIKRLEKARKRSEKLQRRRTSDGDA